MTLSTENLVVGYGDHPIIHQVNLQIIDGKITALIGPNGCGKSTLLKALARLLAPESGNVMWMGSDIRQYPSKDLAQLLSLLPQSQEVPEGVTVRDVVGYGRTPYTGFWGRLSDVDQQKVDEAMALTGVSEFASAEITALSGGQQQRVWLAMTLAQDAEYIFLDEPTTYLDLNHQVELMKLMRSLNENGKTIITVLHDINQACRYCDHLIVMKSGQLIDQGTPEQVLSVPMLKDVFGLDAAIHRDPIAETPMCIVK
ncbi:putative siderophore transport system ATP-binding protein YusV [Vibrio aerogenes CECT 7868]|uniref:Putative siderophore transport system ATP-binding protein YusV n=1 Tax=Vibrio aerogenes CECT 7868 TaxID=1216006 RepID=A0A1M5VXB4_9VIBR|nr:Fe(3+) dicitrate ABC transporter ATP-binding protein FecE [Vibrio aerogenes]SHH79949.1 putative siderophore transport system ATP-binding protein YusV [Vibrio aerogenes CECT 7868]